MAGFLTHEWIAYLVLQKLKRKQIISQSENIDDYFFGAVAPDIRYSANIAREITHKPGGEESIFEMLKMSVPSFPFVAGYETHLITDIAWSNDKNWLKESIYEHYSMNANNTIQKITLYGLVDDYFQAKADWLFPYTCAGYVFRANDFEILKRIRISEKEILAYKSILIPYLREPGIDSIINLGFFPDNRDETLVAQFLDDHTSITKYLQKFEKTAVEKCVESLEKYV
ncbi:MAG: hypothetical protein Q8P05_04260 [Candidatus Diapherotrites archaeon]|nr:hypothetical protein [Candidatus Diapherotrites archaeon]